MRPCDDMFGLVRGNRRKAVSRLKGCLPKDTCSYSLLAVDFYRVFRKCGENRNLPSTPRFLLSKSQVARVQNRGLVGRSQFLPHFRVHLSIMCGGLWNPRERRSFSIKRIAPPGGGFWGAALLVKLLNSYCSPCSNLDDYSDYF